MKSEQMSLIPDEMPTPESADLHLIHLPVNTDLVGSAPTRAFVDSVKAFGILQPIIVVERTVAGYEVIAGRRRIKAARLAGLTTIPARVYPPNAVTYRDVLALVENEQRSNNLASDLDAIEALIRAGRSEAEIAKAVGISKTVLKARMRLLGLTTGLRKAFVAGAISGTVAARAARLSTDQQGDLEEVLAEHGRVTEAHLKEVTSAASLQAVAMLPDVLFRTPDAEVTDWKVEVAALLERALQVVPTIPAASVHTTDEANLAWRIRVGLTDFGHELSYLLKGGDTDTEVA